MKAEIIYDSFFGNTEKIARAIGKAFGSAKEVTTYKADAVKLDMLEGLDYLIVGSPTRAFSPSPLTKSFLKGIPSKQLAGMKVAAFDTRIAMTDKVPGFLRFMANLFGYADKPILDSLKKKGGQETVPPEGFFVLDSEGPLEKGELERAAAWAKLIKNA
ncbi:MAG: flavodoxin family protein [Pelolinea sp.]|nr:flavodoxin family protein [Pelolinea sp.]